MTQEEGTKIYGSIQEEFWSNYDKADHFTKIDLLSSLPLFKNVRHMDLPQDSHIVLNFLQTYLDDYCDYIKNKEKQK
jgi:hypothetical protein